jgi:hypothetical protein
MDNPYDETRPSIPRIYLSDIIPIISYERRASMQ